MKHKIHPEVLPSIKAEFDRLYAKHPGADGTKLWELAEDFVRDIAVADTYLLNFMMQELV